jgi:hypothetical protein
MRRVVPGTDLGAQHGEVIASDIDQLLARSKQVFLLCSSFPKVLLRPVVGDAVKQ